MVSRWKTKPNNKIKHGSNQTKIMKSRYFKVIGAAALALALLPGAQAQTLKGNASAIPAYYDHQLFTIQFVEFAPNVEKTLIQHNSGLNFIYQSDPGLPGGQPFISVLDAIPTDGFNPIWEEVQIAFVPPNMPVQLFSDNEVLAAAMNNQITLTLTGEVYWCPVVGQKP